MKLDFHSHILPGLDDGARDLDDSLMLASAMKGWGFERVYCTPHINALYRNTPESIRPAFEQLQEALSTHNIDLDIRMSAEYRLVPETWPDVLEKGWLMPIEDKYILMELPISRRSEMKNISPMDEFRKIVSIGLTPILPHPERYGYLSHDELLEFVDIGVKIQCNYGSLAGLYGHDAEEIAGSLVKEGIVSFYGTDMHNAHYVDVMGQWFADGNEIADYQ
jgi:tyrosine-protein phosphatase YwqE